MSIRSNMPFMKYFDYKDKPSSSEVLNKIFKTFIENDQLWWCYKRARKRI